MEKKITLSMILGIIFTLNVHAINFYDVTSLQGPIHPLNFYSTRYLDVDTIYYLTYWEMGVEKPEAYKYPTSVFPASILTRSEDGLSDTSRFAMYGVTVDNPEARVITSDEVWISRYSENGRLIYETNDTPISPLSFNLYKHTYEYDNEGRMFRQTTIQTYNGRQTEEEVSVRTYDYSTIQMTDSGYIYGEHNYEYVLDSLGRMMHSKNLSHKDKYVENPEDGKMYRYGDSYYSYTDSSCVSMGYYHYGEMQLNAADAWGKTIYLFNEKGYLKSKQTIISLDGINWTTLHHYGYEYVYSGDNTTNNIHIEETDNIKVYGMAGEINITTDNHAMASVYNFHGQLIKQQQVSQGDNRINLPKGFYIVTVGNKSFKAFVR